MKKKISDKTEDELFELIKKELSEENYDKAIEYLEYIKLLRKVKNSDK
jgi:outer membrane protein assembly factor BamD (BamD/ComL family)